MPSALKSGARRGHRAGRERTAKPPGYEVAVGRSPPPLSANDVKSPGAALRYYNERLAELREMGKGRKRPASDQPVSERVTRSKAAKAATTAPPPPPPPQRALSPVRPARDPLSRPHHPVVKQALAKAAPFRFISLEEKVMRERDGWQNKYLAAKIETGNYQFETACLQTKLKKEQKAAQLGWKLLWNQKARITQLEGEKTGLLKQNRDLANANVQLRKDTVNAGILRARNQAEANAISYRLQRNTAQAETRKAKQQAADQKAAFEAEIAELKQKLAAKEERIKAVFTD